MFSLDISEGPRAPHAYMTTEWQADRLVKLAPVARDLYRRHYLKLAVCELRFPTLYSLEQSHPPASFAHALRKSYPNHALVNEVVMNPGTAPTSSQTHQFKSNSAQWTVSLKASAVAVETQAYPGFDEMRQRIEQLLAATAKVIDSDVVTRVGLRYVNLIVVEGPELGEWVNPTLLQPILLGVFDSVSEFAGRLSLQVPDGGCLLSHGIQHRQKNPGESVASTPNYVIDIDASRNDVALGDVMLAIDRAHDQALSMFDWTLGPAARRHLAAGNDRAT